MRKVEFLSEPSSVSMADEWFELATKDHFWMKWRQAVLLRQLASACFKPETALEIGCGHGVAREMLERDLDIPVDGCDLNLKALEMANPGKGQLYVYDIFDRNPAMLGAYDLVLLMDVIEHIDSDLDFLQASLAHLKPGGMVAINVPAHMSLYGKYDEVAGHKRRYSAADIESLFRKAQVKTVRIVEWGFLLLPLLFLRKLVLRGVSKQDAIRTGFEPSGSFVTSVCENLRRIETGLPFSLPLGSSLLALGHVSVEGMSQ
jgi:SAM-dependent methyltransferase